MQWVWVPGSKELTLLVLRPEYSRENSVNTMAADALAPCFAGPSTAMILTVCKVYILVLYGTELQQTVTFQCQAMIENADIISCALKYIQHDKS